MEKGSMKETNFEGSMTIHFDLIKIWQNSLGAPVGGIDDNFFALGGDMESALAMLREVERVTRKQISTESFICDPTIRGLTRFIIANTAGDGMFVQLQPGTGGLPFYFFHGDILGGGFYTRRLAELLGPRHPFHVSPPIRLSEHELPRVEDLAARKRRALQKQQPHGPYVLGGFCVGAVVAYEVACQLETEGEEVSCVFLVEPEIGNALTRSHQTFVNAFAARHRRPQDKVDLLLRGERKIGRFKDVLHGSLRKKTEFLINNTKKVFGRAVPTTADRNETEGGPEIQDWLVPAYHWVLTSYTPRRFSGPTTMFLTDQHMTEAPFVLRQWRKAVPHLKVEKIPGRHLTCITTHVADLGRKLRAEMEKLNTVAKVTAQVSLSPVLCLLT